MSEGLVPLVPDTTYKPTVVPHMHPVGFEPTLYCYNRILSPARLPVPPRVQT